VEAVQWAVFAGGLGLFPAWAAAAVDGRVAVDLAEERLAAVADVALHDAEVAALADGGPALPAVGHAQKPSAASKGANRFRGGRRE